MNRDRTLTRTIARHEVLPVLARLGPDPVAALARLADVARDDADKLDLDASEVLVGIVRRYGPVWLLRRDDLDGLHPAIANRVVRDVVSHARGTDEPPSSAQVARVLSLDTGAAADLPGVSVTAGGGWLAIGPQDLVEAPDVPLAVPGRTRWGPGRVDVVAIDETSARPADRQLALDLGERWVPPHVSVAPGLVPPGGRDELGQVVLGQVHVADLVVRARRPGDRIRTGGGTRKLQDVLVDAGVPRLIRDLVPVIAHGDRILWIPGIAVDAAAAAAGRRSPRVLLHLAG